VKVCTYSQEGRDYLFEGRYAQRVPQDGAPPTLEQRLVALDTLLDDQPSLKAKGSDVVVSALPAHATSFHRVSLPFTERAQLEQALPFTVENEVPFDLDDMVMGWRVGGIDLQTRVVVALAKKETVTDWLAGLAERGLDPASMHVDGDVYGAWGGGAPVAVDDLDAKPQLVAVVDIGHTDTVVSVIQGGAVQYARSINVAGWNFTRAIQQALGCSWADAEAYKHGESRVDDDITDPGLPRHSGYAALPPEAREAMDASIGLLLAELRSTLIKAEDLVGGEVAELRLCGGSSRIDELWDYLAQDLGVPVGPAKDPTGDACPAPFALAQALAGISIAATGAVDLRVGALAFRGGGDWVKSALLYGSLCVTCFMLVAVPLTAYRWVSMHLEQRAALALRTEILLETFPDQPPKTLEELSNPAQFMREEELAMTERAEVVGGSDGGIPPTLDLVNELTSTFPKPPEVEVEVKSLTITKQNLSFEAETNGFAGSAAVEERLKANPRFATAEKGTETKQSNGVVKFPITIDLTGGAPTGEEG
jgi:Tfp pilus assembly PilM family ATPase